MKNDLKISELNQLAPLQAVKTPMAGSRIASRSCRPLDLPKSARMIFVDSMSELPNEFLWDQVLLLIYTTFVFFLLVSEFDSRLQNEPHFFFQTFRICPRDTFLKRNEERF